ncbi:MAG: hypothetical protein AB4372_08715 [Xenococcus sp. (in: cyanobacteria)]
MSPKQNLKLTQLIWCYLSASLFKDLEDLKGYLQEDTPLYQVFVSEQDRAKQDRANIEWPEPEEELDFKGKGRAASREYLEWAWIKLWDNKLKDYKTNDKKTILKDALKKHPSREDLERHITDLLVYKSSRKELPDNIKKMKKSDFEAFIRNLNKILKDEFQF